MVKEGHATKVGMQDKITRELQGQGRYYREAEVFFISCQHFGYAAGLGNGRLRLREGKWMVW
jgi:hypothetical protein